MEKDDIIREIDSLKTLFYVTLGLVGILVSIFAGSWPVAVKKSTKEIKPEALPSKNSEKE